MISGEGQAWERLSQLDPQDVCSRAKVTFNKTLGAFILDSFTQTVCVSPARKAIVVHSPVGDWLVDELASYSRLAILWYLISAKDIPLSGRLRKPSEMPGGQIYLQGSHALPLDKLVGRYENDIAGFLSRGDRLGGEHLNFGDASLRLWPFPRVPVVFILWRGDREFQSRCCLLFDSTCEYQLPIDIAWATAMLNIMMLLGKFD